MQSEYEQWCLRLRRAAVQRENTEELKVEEVEEVETGEMRSANTCNGQRESMSAANCFD